MFNRYSIKFHIVICLKLHGTSDATLPPPYYFMFEFGIVSKYFSIIPSLFSGGQIGNIILKAIN